MKFVRYWGPVILWMVTIYNFSDRQRIAVSDEYLLNFFFFKTLHVLEYFILYILLYRGLGWGKKERNNKHIEAFIIAILYAISDEIHQAFVPTREAKIRDVIIDGVGLIIAWISIKKLLPKAPLKLRRLAKNLDVHI